MKSRQLIQVMRDLLAPTAARAEMLISTRRPTYIVRPGAIADQPVTAHLSASDSRLGAIQLRTMVQLIAMPGDVAALLLRLAEALEGSR